GNRLGKHPATAIVDRPPPHPLLGKDPARVVLTGEKLPAAHEAPVPERERHDGKGSQHRRRESPERSVHGMKFRFSDSCMVPPAAPACASASVMRSSRPIIMKLDSSELPP